MPTLTCRVVISYVARFAISIGKSACKLSCSGRGCCVLKFGGSDSGRGTGLETTRTSWYCSHWSAGNRGRPQRSFLSVKAYSDVRSGGCTAHAPAGTGSEVALCAPSALDHDREHEGRLPYKLILSSSPHHNTLNNFLNLDLNSQASQQPFSKNSLDNFPGPLPR